MASLLEYVGYVHIYLGPYRGNPIALYLLRSEKGCRISPKAYPWNDVIGIGETPNKAAADFEEKWKGKGLSADMYSGPSWEGGIKPEKPAPPKPAAPPKAAVPPASASPAAAGGNVSAPSTSAKEPASAKTPAQSASVSPAPKSPAEGASPSPAQAKAPTQPASAPPAEAGGNRSQSPDSVKAPAPAKPSTPATPQGHSKS